MICSISDMSENVLSIRNRYGIRPCHAVYNESGAFAGILIQSPAEKRKRLIRYRKYLMGLNGPRLDRKSVV